MYRTVPVRNYLILWGILERGGVRVARCKHLVQRGLPLDLAAARVGQHADKGAALLRSATLLSVAATAPFCFLALRDSLAPALVGTRGVSETGLRLGLAAAVHLLAYLCRDVGLIIALRGALLGSLVCYVMPAIIFLNSARGIASSRLTRLLHMLLAAYGVAMAALGTACVLSS